MEKWILTIIGIVSALFVGVLALVTFLLYRYLKYSKKNKLRSIAQEEQSKKLGYIGPGASTKCKAGLTGFIPQAHYLNQECKDSIISHNQRSFKRSPFIETKTIQYNDYIVNKIDDEDGSPKSISSEKFDVDCDDDRCSGEGSDEEISSKLAATTKVNIEFALSYDSNSNVLTVLIEKVTNLPIKYRKHCSSYVKVSLQSTKKNKSTTYYTAVIHKTLNPQFSEKFSYKMNEDDSEAKLKLSAYVKYHLKDKHIGEAIQPVSKSMFHISVGDQIQFSATLQQNKRRKKKNVLENEDLGQLFLLMQYQSEASRVKILIRKAENLPRINRAKGLGDYYIIMNLMKDNVSMLYKETKSAHGPNPIWNEPFLFDIPFREEISDFWFQFLVMRQRLSSKDEVIGHILIGSETTATGIIHWNEALQPSRVEVAKWHTILPYR